MSDRIIPASEISRRLAERADKLVEHLLPAGRRRGHEWRAGSVAGESGNSLGVHLTGSKAGLWADFSGEQKGDALDLVRQVLGLDTADALAWSRRWLGLEDGDVEAPRRPASATIPIAASSELDPMRWQRPYQEARPIYGTLAATYLAGRGLHFDDAEGRVLRFAARHPRRGPDGELERHPAMLALLSDIRTGEPRGTVNVYLRSDGNDRLRDPKGKTSWGKAGRAAVMLSDFDEPTGGLIVCEGVETGIALLMAGLAPVWALGGAGNLANFPILAGIEALTIAADADEPGLRSAETAAKRWHEAGREAVIVAPPAGDWAAA